MYTKMELQQIGQTILQQMGGQNKLSAMISINHIGVGINEAGNPYISFSFKGNPKITHCVITLNKMDLYDLDFIHIHPRSFERKVFKEVKDIYAENLKSTFENTTELYLSL
ncbi:hypothetical protein [Bacillus cereus]|uniref:hypothetical protein n=1 Tax=Bacillus cereus TaxID=1396 RepID=UPI003078EFA8